MKPKHTPHDILSALHDSIRMEIAEEIAAEKLMYHPTDQKVHFSYEVEHGNEVRIYAKVSTLVRELVDLGWDDDSQIEAVIKDLRKAQGIAERALTKWRAGDSQPASDAQ